MQLKVPLPPKATIDRALARAVAAQGLWAAGGTGLGRTPSARTKARMVRLLWSDPAMLADWGYLATGAGGTKFLSLTAMFVDVLPRLAELERFVGIDWTADPVCPELDPAEPARLRQALKAAVVRQAVECGSMWILQGAEGGRLVAPGFCEGDGGIELEAGERIGDLVEAPVRAGASS